MPDGALKTTLPPSQKLNAVALEMLAVVFRFLTTVCDTLNALQPSELVTSTA